MENMKCFVPGLRSAILGYIFTIIRHFPHGSIPKETISKVYAGLMMAVGMQGVMEYWGKEAVNQSSFDNTALLCFNAFNTMLGVVSLSAAMKEHNAAAIEAVPLGEVIDHTISGAIPEATEVNHG